MEGAPKKISGTGIGNVDTSKELILSHEEYARQPFAKNEHADSYTYMITNGEKFLEYFGTSHTNDPESPLLKKIEAQFRFFRPDIVFVEGMESINTRKDVVRERLKEIGLDEAMRQGENFFTLKLAVDAGVDFESPEPAHAEEIEYLLKGDFSKQDIFNFYMYRAIYQYQRDHVERDNEQVKEYLLPFIEKVRVGSGWELGDLKVFEEALLKELDVKDNSRYASLVDPIPWDSESQTSINEVSRASSGFRNRYIFERIADGLGKHNRVLVVYGSAHAVQHEPALRALFEEE